MKGKKTSDEKPGLLKINIGFSITAIIAIEIILLKLVIFI